ncbi:MAG TPA: efflux RND transporter periplasmic adaptor subunit [bacterium]|nr:efflux RND transporter periplasmic adaptor subunit [bacterium]
MKLRVASYSGLILASLLAFAGGGCGEGASKQTGAGGGAGTAVPVEVMVLQPEPLAHTINTTGTLLANEEVELRPEIAGRIIGVHFQEGGRVAKGALLLKINDSDYKAQLQRKESEEKLAASDEARKRALFESKAISQEDYDKSLNALRIVQADKAVIESQIAKTEIRAPFDGVIGLRHVSEGGYVSPNMLAATMQDIDPMKVEFSVPEKYVHKLRDGLEISVRVGESDTEHRGVIYAVESKIDPGTRTIKARARIPNPDGQLIPGSFARIDITLEQIPDAIVIPTGAVIPELAGAKVYVCENGAARSVPVQTGIRTDRSIQITQGLSPNDTLIVTGLLQLSEGRKVAIRQRQAS